MYIDVKTQLKEGMKIAPIDNQKKEYTLVKSATDNKMYILHNQHIIKLEDMKENELDKKWVCTDLSSLKDEVKCIETENSKPISFDDFCIYDFAQENIGCWDDDFTSVEIRIVRMSREEYMRLKGNDYYLKVRNIIAKKYLEQKENK